jgi:CheY-like chemotaxis protein
MEKNIRVLIVEDEFFTLDMLRDYLEESGYEVSGDAMSAEEAITILEEGQTDLALLDISIKGNQDGIWLAEQINKKYRIPFVFLTAYLGCHRSLCLKIIF